MALTPDVADGASALAFKFDTLNTLATAGAIHSQWLNNGTALMTLDKAGALTLPPRAIPTSIGDGGYSGDFNQEFYAWNGGTPTKHTYTHRTYNVPGFDNYWVDIHLVDGAMVWDSEKQNDGPWNTFFNAITSNSGYISANGSGFLISGKFAIQPYGSNGAGMIAGGTDAINISAANSDTVGLKVRGATSQTADLQQWLDSSGAVKASISSAGVAMATSFRLNSYTVATLPAGTQGDTAFVTDALNPTYLGTLTGGGTTVTPVFYDGKNWVAH
jgi:hypothetical protein